MSPQEIAAYIGAAAWLPQIGKWIYQRVITPVVVIVPSDSVEVGFTSFGPICNVRLALSAENKDVIIDGFELLLRHADGDQRTLRWAGLAETLSEITDAEGRKQQTVSREQLPVALKIGTESLIEKVFRFQEPRYHETDRKNFAALLSHFNYLKQTHVDPNIFVPAALSSKECLDVVNGRRNAFWWKAGKYSVDVRISSPRKVLISNSSFSFALAPVEIEQLQRNIAMVETDLTNTIRSNLSDFKADPLYWNWVYPPLRRE